MAAQWSRHKVWRRKVFAIAIIFFLSVAALIWILNTEHIIKGDWSNILPILFILISVIFAFLTWILPISPDNPEVIQLHLVRKLDRESFQMGDTDAANFHYIASSIQNTFNETNQALLEASNRASEKRGILILGEANAGKTRLAFESLTKTLPNWFALHWRPDYTIENVKSGKILGKNRLVIFIDDLQEYVLTEINSSEERNITVLPSLVTLRTLFETLLQNVPRIVFVVTCRQENEEQVRAVLGELFNKLMVIRLPQFNVDIHDPEAAKIIADFQRYGATHIEDWDGTIGSLVLGLSRKNEKYLKIRKEPAATVLRAMKLLWKANIKMHTEHRLRAVCADVFQEKRLMTDEKIWQEAVNSLAHEQFVTEELYNKRQNMALVIRKDSYFDQVITDYPSVKRPYQLYQDLKKLQEVLVELKDFDALISLSLIFIISNHFQEALTTNEYAIDLDPNDAAAYFNKGHILVHLERYEEALAALDQAIQLDRYDVNAYLLKGDVLIKLERYEEALAALDQAIQLDRYDVIGYFNRGKALARLGRYEEALEDHYRAIRLAPNNANIYFNKGSILFALERYEEALAALDQAIQLDPNNAKIYFYMAMVLDHLERYEEALAAIEEGIQLDPDEVLAYFQKANILEELKRYEEELAVFDQAIQLDPNNVTGYFNKGKALTYLERYDEALDAFDRAIRLVPNNANIYFNKGSILFALERYEEALAAIEEGIQLDPDEVLAYFQKANILEELKRYEEALVAYDQAIQLDPNNAKIYFYKARVLNYLERYEEALAVLDQIIRLDPDEEIAYANKGNILIVLKRYKEALAIYNHALTRNPDFEIVKENRRELLELIEGLDNS